MWPRSGPGAGTNASESEDVEDDWMLQELEGASGVRRLGFFEFTGSDWFDDVRLSE